MKSKVMIAIDMFDKNRKHIFDKKTGDRIGYNVNGQINIFAEKQSEFSKKNSIKL